MTFAEALPHLAAGGKIRRPAQGDAYYHTERGHSVPLDDLLASDWELVEEPEKPSMCGRPAGYCLDRFNEDRATIARLIRELAESADYALDFKRTVERLYRELAEAKRRHCPSCVCVACEQLAANAALSVQGSR